MNKIILIIVGLLSSISYSQKFTVTPNGLKDEINIDKTFVVISIEDKTAKELYENAIKYINRTYKNPDEVIKGKTESEYLKFITHVPSFLTVKNGGVKMQIEANYTTEINFKDGKIKMEIIALDMFGTNGGYKVLFTGGAFDGYPIYNKKGDLKRPETKTDIETYFNLQIINLANALKGITTDDKW